MDAGPFVERLAAHLDAQLQQRPKLGRTIQLIVSAALLLCVCGIAVGGASTRVGGAHPSVPASSASRGRSGGGGGGKAPRFLLADPYAHLTNEEKQQLKEQGADADEEEFDELGRKVKRVSEFVAYNHNPGYSTGGGGSGDGTSLGGNRSKLDAAVKGAGAPKPAAANIKTGAPRPTTANAGLDAKLKFKGRKFLFPLLDQGPNNQFLQLRVALAKARAMNRTLVLPLLLPHNPKFQHLHAGAPPVPSRDRRLDAISYAFESTFDPEHLAKYVRTVELSTFRALADGRLELCYAESQASHDQDHFDSYLRLSALSCNNHTSAAPREGLSSVRFLGYHSYDHEVGTRDRYFEHLRWAPSVLRQADAMATLLFNSSVGANYAAAHIRLADAHWEHTDCKHTINGAVVPSVSCGDGQNMINYTSLAQEMWYMLKRADARLLYVATNMQCSDMRLIRISLMLAKREVKLVCAQDLFKTHIRTDDNYFVSLVEQELCARAHAFIGSKYSTWTDTVWGLRQNAEKAHNYLFEELYVLGVK